MVQVHVMGDGMVETAGRWPVIGHEWAVEHLARAIAHERIRHAYLLVGPDRIGKTTLAYALAMALNCTSEGPRPCGKCRACTLIARRSHPDVTLVEAEQVDGTLKIDQVRALQQTLSLRPYEARYRVAILRRFHEANPAAQNALLKTLEEPAPNVVLVLTARAADAPLLPTVSSRCQPLNLRPLPVEQVREALEWAFGAPQDVAKRLALLSGGRIGWAVSAYAHPEELEQRERALSLLETALTGRRLERFKLVEGLPNEKNDLLALLRFWVAYWRDVVLVASGSRAPITNDDRRAEIIALAGRIDREAAQRALAATMRTMELLGRNANTRLAFEVLMLDYPGL